jgi:hypothetical protein
MRNILFGSKLFDVLKQSHRIDKREPLSNLIPNISSYYIKYLNTSSSNTTREKQKP